MNFGEDFMQGLAKALAAEHAKAQANRASFSALADRAQGYCAKRCGFGGCEFFEIIGTEHSDAGEYRITCEFSCAKAPDRLRRIQILFDHAGEIIGVRRPHVEGKP